ncbi:tyrosine-type recombinase/integrase [Chitinophaga sp. CF418]|uniref:tyrosine-type recombinase/integrase n=1 Tax=Chitinophaga sp. CF418 TaxID=1855287 RepID=UPI00091FC668|nr:tyrosine-type recombinase/integrase [Chitinophaga sp. CF418]SHL87669.1 Phage integrase family protein [Chitinophaga sp. CF418]
MQNTFEDIKIYGERLDQEWFVGFKFYCAQRKKKKRPQVRLGINYYNTVRERSKEAENVKALVEQCLKEGWNPFESSIKEFITAQQTKPQGPIGLNDARQMNFVEAITWAYKKKDLRRNSKRCFDPFLKKVIAAATDLCIHTMHIREVSRYYVKELLDRMKLNRQRFYDTSQEPQYKGKTFTPNLYNSYLAMLSCLFFELEDSDVIEYNPCEKITRKTPIDFGTHRHPTELEVKRIKEFLAERHPQFLSLLRVETVTGMRPNEILDVKFSMIDYLNSTINISDALYNEAGELISKTPAYRRVPVPCFLLEWFKERAIGQPDSNYIFSRRFCPGPHKLTAHWVSVLWRQLIIEDLGIKVSFYSFKGWGGDAKRDAGIDIEAVAASYGHTSTNMARGVYLKKEGERLRKQIIEKTPDL